MLFAILSRFILLIALLGLSGLVVLHAIGFRARRHLDVGLGAFAAGIAANALAGYLLLFAGLYRPFIHFGLLVVAASLVWFWRRKRTPLWPVEPAPEAAGAFYTWPDRIALVLVGVWLALGWLDALTSPITNWDALVAWGKWMTDWARLGNFANYPTGNYPQTLPIIGSLLYLYSGASSAILPADLYAWHGLQAVFAAGLVVCLVRLAQYAAVPVWAVLLLTLCQGTYLTHWTAGTAESLLVFLAAAPALLLRAESAGDIRIVRGRAAFLGLLLFALGFTKVNGLIILVLAVWLARVSLVQWSWREVAAFCLIPLCLIGAFAAHQWSVGRLPAESLAPDGLYFPTPSQLKNLTSATATSYSKEKPHSVANALRRALDDYRLPKAATTWLGLLLGAALLASIAVPEVRPYGATFVLALPVWYFAVAYDTRNLLYVFAYMALAAVGGLTYLWRVAQRQRVAMCALVVAVAWPAVSLAGRFVAANEARLDVLSGDGKLTLGRRFSLLHQGPAAIVPAFWPDYESLFNKLYGVPSAHRAPRFGTNTALCRWFERPVYVASVWNEKWLVPGSFFVGGWGQEPPDYGDWAMVLHDHPFKVWVRLSVDSLPPPGQIVLKEMPQRARLLAWNVTRRDLKAGDAIVWRAEVAAPAKDPNLAAGWLLYDPQAVDEGHSFTAVDDSRAKTGTVSYGGLLTVGQDGISQDPERDAVLVGLQRTGDAAPLEFRQLRVTVLR